MAKHADAKQTTGMEKTSIAAADHVEPSDFPARLTPGRRIRLASFACRILPECKHSMKQKNLLESLSARCHHILLPVLHGLRLPSRGEAAASRDPRQVRTPVARGGRGVGCRAAIAARRAAMRSRAWPARFVERLVRACCRRCRPAAAGTTALLHGLSLSTPPAARTPSLVR